MNPFIDSKIRMMGPYRMVHYISANAAKIVEQFKNKEVDGIYIHTESGLREKSLKFLYALDGLKAITFQQQSDLALDVLYDMPQLEDLSIDETKSTLDFERLKNLTSLSVDWHKKLFKNADSSKLKVLALSKYKSVANDMTDFPQFYDLQRLVLVQGTITSLHGISRFSKLNDLAVHYLSKLEHLDGLNLPELTKFRAENCKNLSDYQQLATCKNLEQIRMLSCGAMQSLEFVRSLKKLKSFNFLKTEVTDGDLSPLLDLDSVNFTEKKHYSHKTKNFNQMMDGVNVHKAE